MTRVPISGLMAQHRQYGGALPAILATAAIIIVLAIAAWFLIIRPHHETNQTELPQTASGPEVAASVAEPPVDVASLGISELITEAKEAMNEKRIIAPAGNNAFAFYLGVLEKDPNNRVAQDALRETFPFAASAVEQDIDANRFAEAEREIELLSRADPANYTLTILRSKLDAQRKLAARAEEQAKIEEQRAQLAAQRAAQQANQPEQPETVPSPPQPEPQVVQQQAPEPAPQPEPVVQPEPEPEPVGPTRGPIVVKNVKPSYPRDAMRRRQEGWVRVEFTVDVNGNVVDAHVVNAERGRIFRRAALSAIEEWKFKPALKDGKPVSAVLQRRFEFNF